MQKNKFFAYIYNNIYLSFIKKLRCNVNICKWGIGNSIEIPPNTCCDNLVVIIKGNNNRLKVGKNCNFFKSNEIYIEGHGNTITIGDNVIFDQNVGLVCCEGTTLSIGSDCIFANGVRIRTSDQHAIYDRDGKRINYSKDIKIGNHVWLGASAIVMKGSNIGNETVVGIESMVFGEIPNNSIAVGRPAKVIRTNIRWDK